MRDPMEMGCPEAAGAHGEAGVPMRMLWGSGRCGTPALLSATSPGGKWDPAWGDAESCPLRALSVPSPPPKEAGEVPGGAEGLGRPGSPAQRRGLRAPGCSRGAPGSRGAELPARTQAGLSRRSCGEGWRNSSRRGGLLHKGHLLLCATPLRFARSNPASSPRRPTPCVGQRWHLLAPSLATKPGHPQLCHLARNPSQGEENPQGWERRRGERAAPSPCPVLMAASPQSYARVFFP